MTTDNKDGRKMIRVRADLLGEIVKWCPRMMRGKRCETQRVNWVMEEHIRIFEEAERRRQLARPRTVRRGI